MSSLAGVRRAVLNSKRSGNGTSEAGAPTRALELSSVSMCALASYSSRAGLLLAYARADVRQQCSHSQLSFCAAS